MKNITINNKLVKKITIDGGIYYDNTNTSEWWEKIGVRADYITSDGKAYIDTNYKLQYDNGTTEIGVSVENVDNGTSIYGFIERSGNLANRISVGSTASGFFVGSGNTVYMESPTIPNKKYVVEWNRKTEKTILNGVEYDTPRVSGLTTTYTAYLCSRNDKGAQDAEGKYNLIGNIYYLREILDNVVQFSYIPIKVTKQFVDNKGITHNVGSYIMVNELVNNDVPTHYGEFTGIVTENWWKEYGVRAEYIENVDNESYIVTDVTPKPNELLLNIECVFLNDITSAPFGCRPTGNASPSSNNIFQVNNNIRIDLLGDASLSIPKENNILYNIDYTGADNVFTINGTKYNGSFEKSSTEVTYPFAIFANNSEGVLSVGSACVMRYGKFNINDKQYIPIQVIKQFTDNNGVIHNVGDYLMVNSLLYKDVPTHVGGFTGEIKLDNYHYFKSVSQQNPYYDLGRRIAYGKRVDISISFEDTTIDPYPLYGLFGSRQGYSQSTAYNTFIGRNDLPMATDVAISMIPIDRKFTITLEDGKGYIDGVLTTTDTAPVAEWDDNSFLYNVNTEGLGGPMNTYRLPIGTRVYGCQIYDVATGVIENNYQPQLDQTLKCSVTGEVLPKLGINPTDSWEVKYTNSGDISQELMWFETTPSDTSIKTNFIPTNVTAPLTKIELMCSITSGSVGYLVNGIGGGPTMYIGMNPAGNIAYGNLASDANVSYKLNYDTYHKITLDYKNKTISINDVVIANDIRLYSYNRNDTAFGINCYVNPANNTIFNNWGQKTQYCKIYVDDVLTHHWVGQLNKGVADVYDKIEEVYLSEAGTIVGQENIIAGPIKVNE